MRHARALGRRPRTTLGEGLAITPIFAAAAEPRPSAPAARPFVYGSNAAAGGSFEHDGVKLYDEVYGKAPRCF